MAHANLYPYFMAFAAALGGLLFGYEIGIINSVLEMDPFKLYFGLSSISADNLLVPSIDGHDTIRKAIIVSSFLIGCIPGALMIALGGDFLGRKRAIFIGAVLFTLGGFMQAFAPDIDLTGRLIVFTLGRFMGGWGVGMLSGSVPLYIAEIAPSHQRGRLTSVQQLMITIGIALASICNAIIIASFGNVRYHNDIQWRLALVLQSIPGLLLIIMLFFLPESPRWLLSRGHVSDALTHLAKSRQSDIKDPLIQDEFAEYQSGLEAEKRIGQATWAELLRPGIRNRLVIGILLQFFQQWTGINAIMYYSSGLFMGMGVPKVTATTVAVVIQSLVNVFGTFPGMYLVERAGRTKLLKWGGFAMAFFGWAMVLCVNLFQSTSNFTTEQIAEAEGNLDVPASARAWSIMAVLSMYCFVICFASSWGPIVWVYQSEIFPLRVRGKGTGIATASNWVNNAILSFSWPFISNFLGPNQYAVFGCTGIVMALYVHFQVPETKGSTLEEMDRVFGLHAVDAERIHKS